MSGYLSGKVWLSALHPDLKPLAATLADIGDDDGSSIYPSVAYVCWRLGRSESVVREGLRRLREMGALQVVRDGGGRHKPTEYLFDVEKLPSRPLWKGSDYRRESRKNPPVYRQKPSGLQGKTLRPTGPHPLLPVIENISTTERNHEHQLRADAWAEIRKQRAMRAGVR